jgi:catechol-2,3-dioxygenase
MMAKGRDAGIETRGPSDHGAIESVYFRDPNGYVIELCAKRAGHDDMLDPNRNGARDKLDTWQRAKASPSTPIEA